MSFWLAQQKRRQRAKIDTLDCIKIKNFCALKDESVEGKGNQENEGHKLQVTYLIRSRCPECIRNSHSSSTTETKQLIQERAEDSNRCFSRKTHVTAT